MPHLILDETKKPHLVLDRPRLVLDEPTPLDTSELSWSAEGPGPQSVNVGPRTESMQPSMQQPSPTIPQETGFGSIGAAPEPTTGQKIKQFFIGDGPKVGRWTKPTRYEKLQQVLSVPTQVWSKFAGGKSLFLDRMLWYGAGKLRPDITGDKTLEETIESLEPNEKSGLRKMINEVAEFMGSLQTAHKLLGTSGAKATKAGDVARIMQKFSQKAPAWMVRGAIEAAAGGIEKEMGLAIVREAAKGAAVGGVEALAWSSVEVVGSKLFGKVWEGVKAKYPNFAYNVSSKYQKAKAEKRTVEATKNRMDSDRARKHFRKHGTIPDDLAKKYGFGQAAGPKAPSIPAEQAKVKDFGKYPLGKPTTVTPPPGFELEKTKPLVSKPANVREQIDKAFLAKDPAKIEEIAKGLPDGKLKDEALHIAFLLRDKLGTLEEKFLSQEDKAKLSTDLQVMADEFRSRRLVSEVAGLGEQTGPLTNEELQAIEAIPSVSKQGKVEKFYHGTFRDFEQFEAGTETRKGKGTEADKFYFTQEKAVAERFSKQKVQDAGYGQWLDIHEFDDTPALRKEWSEGIQNLLDRGGKAEYLDRDGKWIEFKNTKDVGDELFDSDAEVRVSKKGKLPRVLTVEIGGKHIDLTDIQNVPDIVPPWLKEYGKSGIYFRHEFDKRIVPWMRKHDISKLTVKDAAESGFKSTIALPEAIIQPTAAKPKQTWEMTREEYIDSRVESIKEREIEKGRPWNAFEEKGWRSEAKIETWMQQRRSEIRSAYSQNKPVPRSVLEEYKSEQWAKDAIAKLEPKKGKEAPKKLTPAMKQHAALKEKYPDTVILMKMGDFYEAFGEDAKILRKELGLTLTKRGDVPMAGVPYHSINQYLKKLVQAGHKVALVEETSKKPDGKIKRDVVKITKPKGGKGFKPGALDVKAIATVHKTFINIIEPAKPVEIKYGKDVSAAVIKGIHAGEVGRVEFTEAQIEHLDRSLGEFGKLLGKYPKRVLTNLMAARGNPASASAIAVRDQALSDLIKENPELVGVRRMITRVADFNYKFLQKVVGDDINYVEDYFFGIYKDTKKATVEGFLNHWKTTKRFTKEKKLPTYADAIAYGVELKDINPINNLMTEYVAIARLKGMIDMREELLRLGKDRFISEKESNVAHPKVVNEPVFKGLFIDEPIAHLINNLISTNKVSRHPHLNNVRILNNTLRAFKFAGSAFHHLAVLKQSIADSGYLGFLLPHKWVNVHVRPGKLIPFGLHQGTAARGFTLGFRNSDPIFRTPNYKRYIANAGGHRYSIESETQRAISNAVEKFNKAGGPLVRAGTFVPQIPVRYVKWLFQNYIPKIKYMKTLDVWQAKAKKLGREITDAELQEIIKENQNFYGMMNERLFGRSGTATTLLRFRLISPGYWFGNVRTEGKAGIQWGGGDQFNATRSRSNIVNSFLLTGIAATVATLILTGKPPKMPKTKEDVRDLFKVDTGQVDSKGRSIMIDLMTYDKDYWNLYGKVLTGQIDEIPGDLFRRVTGMGAVAWEVMSDLNQMSLGKAVYDWKGDRVVEVTDPFAQQALSLIWHEAQKAEPISTNVFRQARNKDLSLLHAATLTLLGLRVSGSEKDIREQKITNELFSLRDRQERLYYYLGTIKNPRKHVDRYNHIVKDILENPITTDAMRLKWAGKLKIDVKRLLQNKAYFLSQLNRTPDEIKKTKAYLDNFDVSPEQAQEFLRGYWARERTKTHVSPLERDRVIGRKRKRDRLTERLQ